MIILSGSLTNPFNKPYEEGELQVRFTCAESNATVLRGCRALLPISSDGKYHTELSKACYHIEVYEPSKTAWNSIGYVDLFTANGEYSIPELIEVFTYTPESEFPSPEFDEDWDKPIGDVCAI